MAFVSLPENAFAKVNSTRTKGVNMQWIGRSLVLVAILQVSNSGASVQQPASDKPAMAKTQATHAQIKLIRQTLLDYIEGSTNGQPDRLRKAFHPDLNLYSIRNEKLSIWAGTDYIKDTKEGKPTGERGKILAIDFENDCAVAKVEIAPPGSVRPYVDYFMLLKVKEKWTIVHKMYTRQSKQRGSSGTWQHEVEPAGDAQQSAVKTSTPEDTVAATDAVSAPTDAVSAPTEEKIDAIFKAYDKPDSPGAALAVIQNGKVVFKKSYGNANLEHRLPITTDSSVFNIASASKQVTAFAILLLVEQKKLSLDDDVRKYIPELHKYPKQISVRHLVHHTSGLRSDGALISLAGWWPGDNIGTRDMLGLIYRQKELNFQPGDDFDYCNSGYDLLAEIVARASGQSFAEFCRAQIFDPLEMKKSFFITSGYDLIPGLVYPYGSNAVNHWRQFAAADYSGSTGLYTTVDDLSKWVLNFQNTRIGNSETMRLMDTLGVLNNGEATGYAFGQFVETYKGLKHIQHGGASSGYRSYIGRFPDQTFSTVLLGNTSGLDSRSKSLALADIFLGDSFKDATAAQSQNVPIGQLQRLTGSYWNNKDRSVRIHVEDGDLVYSISGGPDVNLTPLSASEFQMKNTGTDNRVRFEAKSGKYVMHTTSGGRATDTYEAYEAVAYADDELNQYVGTFYSDELATTYAVDVEGGHLRVSHLRAGSIILDPVKTDIFKNRGWRFQSLAFERDTAGNINGFRVSAQRAKRVRFRKQATNFYKPVWKSLANSLLHVVKTRGHQAARAHFSKLMKSAGYHLRESEMNAAGYELLNDDRVREAIEIFKLNAESFRRSWNAFDSLGEAYAKIGDTKLAIECYQKSLQLNPQNAAGAKVLKQLTASEHEK